jgi:NADPH-dependent F420 reductase
MRITILGGTGDIGEGLALRWARDTGHEVLVGSRDAGRARAAAREYLAALEERGVDGTVSGFENAAATDRGDVIVLAVPPYVVADTIERVETEIGDAVLVSPAVGLGRDESGFHHDPPPVGSVTAHAARTAPEGVPVVGTFHNLPAARLTNLDADLGLDTPVVGEAGPAKETVMDLVNAIEGLGGLDAGGMGNAPEAEGMVPLLLNVAANEGLDDIGIAFR